MQKGSHADNDKGTKRRGTIFVKSSTNRLTHSTTKAPHMRIFWTLFAFSNLRYFVSQSHNVFRPCQKREGGVKLVLRQKKANVGDVDWHAHNLFRGDDGFGE